MKIMILILLTTIFLAACTQTPAEVNNLTPKEFKELIQDDKVFLLDTHTPEQLHISGTDAVIPYNEIVSQMDKLPLDLNTPIAVYCRSGSMSAGASQDLIDMGYKNVYDLQGGRNAYVAAYGE